MIQQHTVDLDETQIHYAEAPGPGPALVILHGATGSHTTFLPFLPALAQHAHVYALDLRGHGLSGHTPDAYRLADYGRDDDLGCTTPDYHSSHNLRRAT